MIQVVGPFFKLLEKSTSVLIEHSLDDQIDGFKIPILDGK